MSVQDRVVWASVNASADGKSAAYLRGELLPAPITADEVAQRSLLRIGGAIQTVEVVYTPEELAEQAQARAEATALSASALDVDTSLPLGQQTVGSASQGPPTLMTGAGSPVVVGSREDKATKTGDEGSKPADDKSGKDDKGDVKEGNKPVVVGSKDDKASPARPVSK